MYMDTAGFANNATAVDVGGDCDSQILYLGTKELVGWREVQELYQFLFK